MTSGNNKRAYPRFPLRLDALAVSPQGGPLNCVVEDFCQGGMLVTFYPQVAHAVHWRSGDPIEVRFPQAAGPTVRGFVLRGTVARVVDIGVGVSFNQVDGAAFQYLMSRVQQGAAAAPSRTTPPDSRYAILGNGCRDKTKVFLERLAEDFIVQGASNLDKADELSKKNWRGIIEAQQKLRAGRKQLIDCYVAAIMDEFDQKGKPIKQQPALEDATELSLVAEQDFQTWLTVTALVTKLDAHNENLLFELEQRLGLVLNRQLNRQLNPIGSTVLAQRFHECFDAIGLDEEMQPYVFKAFEDFTLNQTGRFYEQINGYLKEQGVLPDLKKDLHLVRQPGAAHRPPPPAPVAEPETSPPEGAADYAGAASAPASGGSAAAAPAGAGTGPGAAGGGQAGGGGSAAPAAAAPGGGQAGGGYSAPAGAAPGGVAPAPAGGAPAVAAAGYAGTAVGGTGYVAEQSPYAAANELLQLERVAQQSRPAVARGTAGQAAGIGGAAETAATAPAASGPVVHFSPQELNSGLDRLQQQGVSVRNLRQQGGSLASRLAEVLAEQSGDPSKQLPLEMHDKLEVTESLLSSIQTDAIADTHLKDWFESVELPFIKMALNNEQVLQDRSHPVHHLFNTLDQLFQMLPPEKGELRKQLVGKVEKALESLSEESGGDPAVLDEAVNSLNKLYGEQSEEYRRKVDEVIAKCQAEPNQRQMTLDMLEDIDRLFDLAEGRLIPRVILELLDAGWKNLLWRHSQRDGMAGDGYRAARATMEQLLTRLQGKPQKGIKADWPNHKLVEEVSKVLERLNKDDTRSLVLVSELISDLEQAKLDPAKVGRIRKGSIAQLMLQSWEQEKLALKPVELSKSEWSRWLKRAEALGDGELVSYKSDKEDLQQQKLVWSDRKWGRYVFVDREGNKGLDVRPEEMAAAMSRGRMLILEGWDRPLMDRATYTMLQSIHDRLIEQTNHDALTSLMNRRGFEGAMEGLLNRANRDGSDNVLCYFDLDRFNVINVTCGHEAGDELLGNLADLLRSKLGPDTVFARLGGDEFGILLEGCDRERGMKRSEDIRRTINDYHFRCENKEFVVDASFGVASIDPQRDSVRTLLAAVDSACFAAKEAGRGRVQFYDPQSEIIMKRQGVMEWVGRINKLFDAGLIQLKCQKIASLKFAHEHPRYEILLHVHNEQGELVSLDQFVLSAEIYNRILDIDRWVVDKVFDWLRTNRSKLNNINSISVNLSGHTIDDEAFMDELVQRLENAEVPSHQICFEITETAAISSLDRAVYYMRRLRQAGCQLALDDFGSGHASYSYLKSMPIDYLKIDGQFIRNIATNVFDYSVVKSIHEMAHALGKRTIAEYIESEVALDKLRKIGVDFGQGYIIEKPIPLDELILGAKR
jgi:diguanylate cyclase (GGDEF)-like protein